MAGSLLDDDGEPSDHSSFRSSNHSSFRSLIDWEAATFALTRWWRRRDSAADRTNAAARAKSALIVALGRRITAAEPDSQTVEHHDADALLTTEPPGTVTAHPAAPHGPPAVRVGAAA